MPRVRIDGGEDIFCKRALALPVVICLLKSREVQIYAGKAKVLLFRCVPS